MSIVRADARDSLASPVCGGFELQTVEPSAPLSEELDALYDFLAHQKSVRATGDRDWIGAFSSVDSSVACNAVTDNQFMVCSLPLYCAPQSCRG